MVSFFLLLSDIYDVFLFAMLFGIDVASVYDYICAEVTALVFVVSKSFGLAGQQVAHTSDRNLYMLEAVLAY